MATHKRKAAVDNGDPAAIDPPMTDKWQYETSVTQVEAILHLIESGDMDLADVFEQFTVAIGHLKQCEQFLGDRQEQVDLLIETLTD
jgi:exodeoxyribonuclease VII small subunit